MDMERRKREGGFTLVELLVVVAIIAVLAAIAIPRFTNYRYKGFKAQIDSDTKSAYTAAQAYLTDSPAETIDSLDKLEEGGFIPSKNTTFVSADMTLDSGQIVLQSTTLNASAKHNVSRVFYNGRYNLVNSPF